MTDRTMNVDEILRVLPRLAAGDLRQIKDRMGFLARETPDSESVISEDLIDLVKAMTLTLARQGLAVPPQPSVALKLDRGRQLPNNAQMVRAFADTCLPNARRTERVALYRTFITVLSRELQRQGIPITFWTLVQGLKRIPELVNRSFPGYVQAGLGRFLVRVERT